MTLRTALDTSTSLARVVGDGAGFSRTHLRAQLTRFKGIHEDMESAIEGGLLPHVFAWVDGSALERAAVRASNWQREAERIVVLGSPDAVASVRVLAQLAVPGSGRNRNIRWVDSPDPAVLQSAFHPRDGNWLIVLDGPHWVRRLAESLQERVVGTTVFVGDGTPEDEWVLGDGERVVEAGAADPRFGVLGAAAASLMAVAGVDPLSLVSGVTAALEACRRPALYDNPAYRMAALLHTAAETLNLGDTVFLLATPQLQRWGDWVRNSWAAVTTQLVEHEGLQRHLGSRPQVVQLADECALERLVNGPTGHLVLALWVDDPGQDLRIGDQYTAWLMARDLMDEQVAQLVTAGRPVINVRVPELAPDTVGELCVIFLHALLALQAGRGGDPLAMSAADTWRRMHEAR